MVAEAIKLKGDGLADADIICALGIHPSTFYRWIGEPKNKLQRELSDGLKKEEAEFKHTLLTTIRAAALARNQYWTAAAWLLERKYPDEYGKADRRREDEGASDTPRLVLGVVAKPVQEKLDLSFDEDGEAPRSSRHEQDPVDAAPGPSRHELGNGPEAPGPSRHLANPETDGPSRPSRPEDDGAPGSSRPDEHAAPRPSRPDLYPADGESR
jgi:hypothetical protein